MISAYSNESIASTTTVGCCVYPPVTLSGNYGNVINGNGNYHLLAGNYYGQSNNINFSCVTPCPPNILISTQGSSKNLVGIYPKLSIGNDIGIFGSKIIANPNNNLVFN